MQGFDQPGKSPSASRLVRWGPAAIPVSLDDVPMLGPAEFSAACVTACREGARLCALAAVPLGRRNGAVRHDLLAALARDGRGEVGFVRAHLEGDRAYPALCAVLPQAQAFERDLFEEHGIRPSGHPWLKPLRRHAELEQEMETSRFSDRFFRVSGTGVHEVAVGPVHAGIIEPGHFRFQCHGERVLHLEIHLGYQHRGAEALLLGASPARRLVVAESIAGDSVVGHALAYSTAIEAVSGVEPPLHAQVLRGIALEIERVANHVGDLGALCNDVGYLPGASCFGRLRGEFLNVLLEVSGNRFGRGLVIPGGVRFDAGARERRQLASRIERAERDLAATAELVFDSPSVLSRFEQTGVVSREVAEDLGLVGPAARASGCSRDVRRDHPTGIHRFAHVPVSILETGDVLARALVRWLEVQRSLVFVREQLGRSSERPLAVDARATRARSAVLCLVEGWRGEIAHLAVTGDDAELLAYKIVDPSFHNWFALAMAMRGNQISDFPLCNKSFNLSYAGHDL